MVLDAVGKAAARIVEEVRRQFQANPAILAGKVKPDYARAVVILTRTAILGMIAPGILPILAPVVAAWAAPWLPSGSMALLVGGMLIGSVTTGLILALSMGTSGRRLG